MTRKVRLHDCSVLQLGLTLLSHLYSLKLERQFEVLEQPTSARNEARLRKIVPLCTHGVMLKFQSASLCNSDPLDRLPEPRLRLQLLWLLQA